MNTFKWFWEAISATAYGTQRNVVRQREGEGLECLMGKEVTFFCINYIYAGKLVGVNADCVKLENPKIVYETGAFTSNSWKDAQALPKKYWYVAMQSIESFGEMK